MQTLNWFKERIGKIIYRDRDDCKCGTCKDAVNNGIEISDDIHAEYLFDVQNDFANEGTLLNYRDVL